MALDECHSRTGERQWEMGQRRRIFHQFKASMKVKSFRAAASRRISSSTAEKAADQARDSNVQAPEFQRMLNSHVCYAKARALLEE